MKLYMDFIRELEGFECLHHLGKGFLDYKWEPDHVFIRNVYVAPEARGEGLASAMEDAVLEMARARGIKKVVGLVVPSHGNAEYRMQIFFKRGWKFLEAQQDAIYLVKDI